MACMLAPLYFCSFRAAIDPLVTASDASERGGCLMQSAGLTLEGQAESERIGIDHDEDCDATLSAADELVLLSLFDGIGGQRRAMDLLGVAPALYISVECSDPATRVVRRAWPDAIHIKDVKEINAQSFYDWRAKRPRVKRLIISAGFPCQGMSGLNSAAKGLEDPRSGLFWEILRIQELARNE